MDRNRRQPAVLLVDDDVELCQMMAEFLGHHGFRVSTVHDGRSGLAAAFKTRWDLVILDVMLPVIDGFEVLRQMRRRTTAPVIMLTARADERDRVAGLEEGADDYLVKPFAYEELLARVRALLRRHAPGPRRPMLRWDDVALDVAAHEAWRGQRPIELTAQEFKLLEQFLEHPRQVLTRQGLLGSVWGFPTDTASNVVDVYVGYLRQKLEAAGEPRVIQTVRGVGYVLRSG